MEDGSVYTDICEDLVLVSSDDMFRIARKQVLPGTRIVRANLTISRKGYEAIQALPKGTRALLVNVNMNLSLQCVERRWVMRSLCLSSWRKLLPKRRLYGTVEFRP